MKVKRDKLLGLWVIIQQWKEEKTNVVFHFTLLRMQRAIAPEVETIQEVRNGIVTPEFKEYTEKRIQLCEEYCDRDEDEKPVMITNMNGEQSFHIKEDLVEEFDEKFKILESEYLEAIDMVKHGQEQLMQLLAEDIEIDLPMIKLDTIPKHLETTGAQAELLFEFIEE